MTIVLVEIIYIICEVLILIDNSENDYNKMFTSKVDYVELRNSAYLFGIQLRIKAVQVGGIIFFIFSSINTHLFVSYNVQIISKALRWNFIYTCAIL